MESRPSARRLPVMAAALLILAVAVPPPAFCESTHALSLQRLARELQACQGNGTCPRSLLEFDGLRVIDGYVIDPGDGDVLLVGRRGGDLPPLHVEDFAVALRNTWLSYAERQANRVIYSHPGCSIDPDPAVMRELESLASRVMGGDGESQEEWDRVCRKPQAVRVMGMPFHTRFAQVMVEADYDMKSMVDGSASLDVAGLEGLTTMTLAQARRDVEAGRPISIPMSAMNRFWFYPGENVWEEDDGVVLIRESPVTLLSNQMFVNAKNELVDAVERDALAERFAASFTRLYDEVADRRPIYRELEGLFRFVALAKILEAKVRSTPAEATLGYYLETFPVPRADVPTKLPGRSHADGFEHRQAVAGGVRIMSLRLPSCGGVSIDLEADPESFRPGRGDDLSRLKSSVLDAKRAESSVSFLIPVSPGGSTTERSPPRTEKRVFVVRNATDGVRLVTSEGETGAFYSLRDVDQLVRDVTAQNAAGRIYLDLQGFSADRAEAFRTDYRLSQGRIEAEATLVVTVEAGELLTRPVRIADGPTAPRQITAGEYQGWWQSTIYFVQDIGGTLREVALDLRARSLELLELLVATLRALLHAGPESLPSLIDRSYRQIESDLSGSFHKRDIELRIHQETGRCHVVERPSVRERLAT